MQFCSLIIVLGPLSTKQRQSFILTPNPCSFTLLRSSWDFAIPFKRKISENISDNYYAIYKSKQSWKQAIDENEGTWDANCNECYKAELIREYVTDMEFVALDKDGKTVNADPTENLEEMFNIRSVDVKITFRSSSKKGYFQKKQQKLVNSFTADRSIQSDDNYLRENIFVTVHTRNIGGAL